MLYVVLFFLVFSLFLYVLLGGADYGAGILELFSSKEHQKLTKKTLYRVMGPVWEANHIWIIILVVILWVAFPIYYNILVVYLHIPLTLVLLGITMRGVAFVFRHYDAVIDHSQKLYDWMFKISSLVTPIFLGMVFGGLISGKLPIDQPLDSLSFYQAFVLPWLNPFSILVGLFFAGLCTFLAAILLIGESSEKDSVVYIKKASKATFTVFILGLITFIYGYFNEYIFITGFITNPYAVLGIILSGILLVPLWKTIKNGHRVLSRLFAGIQIFLIVVAALIVHFPNIIISKTNKINLLDNIAPQSVIQTLAITLIIGGILILPGLFHLLKSFKMIKILEQKKPST